MSPEDPPLCIGEWTPWTEASEGDRARLLQGVRAEGYELQGLTVGLRDLYARVLREGTKCAEADFGDDFDFCHCNNVKVRPDHRRKGLATAMYIMAEEYFAKCLCNFWKGDRKQSDEAKRLWQNRRSLFGHPPGICEKCDHPVP